MSKKNISSIGPPEPTPAELITYYLPKVVGCIKKSLRKKVVGTLQEDHLSDKKIRSAKGFESLERAVHKEVIEILPDFAQTTEPAEIKPIDATKKQLESLREPDDLDLVPVGILLAALSVSAASKSGWPFGLALAGITLIKIKEEVLKMIDEEDKQKDDGVPIDSEEQVALKKQIREALALFEKDNISRACLQLMRDRSAYLDYYLS